MRCFHCTWILSYFTCAFGCNSPSSSPASTLASATASSTEATDPLCVDREAGSKFCVKQQVLTCRNAQTQVEATCEDWERCDAGECVLRCPKGEVYIPSTGPKGFTMGRAELKARGTPHVVVLTKPFCMDETEVTAGAFAACIEAGACEEPYKWDPWASYPRFPDRPVNLVSQTKAAAYCAWKGKVLPTEAQWEWAASAGQQVEWPWGNEEPTCHNDLLDFTPFGAPKSAPGGDVGCRGGGPSDVKSFPKGAKAWPSGKLYDMAGNVWEWTRDMAMPYPTGKQVDPEVKQIPSKPDNTLYVIRGGGWNRSSIGCKVWFRGEATRRYQVPGLGFRCIRETLKGFRSE